MPLVFGALFYLVLSAAGVTGALLALVMGKVLLAIVLAAFAFGTWLRLKRSTAGRRTRSAATRTDSARN